MGVLGELLAARFDEAARPSNCSTITVIPVSKVARAQSALRELPYRDAVAQCFDRGPARLRRVFEAMSGGEGREVEGSDFHTFVAALRSGFDDPTLLALTPDSIEKGSARALEACSGGEGCLVDKIDFHPFVAAVHSAFDDHRPLVLTPDSIWLLIAQGFAEHVNANAERLRKLLVGHKGRAQLRVRRDDFVKGSAANPWIEVFDAFTVQIRHHLGARTHDLLLPAFSTTTVDSMAVAQIVLMDTVKTYFNYLFQTLCGIPEIVLEGTADDWERVATHARSLEQFDLQWWTRTLIPVLDEFVKAARGEANPAFWRCLYKEVDMSGGPYIYGWINVFFPYRSSDGEIGTQRRRNPLLDRMDAADLGYWAHDAKGFPSKALSTASLPSGLARCPFEWDYCHERFAMEFVGGFVGVRQCASTLRLKPEIGWVVRSK